MIEGYPVSVMSALVPCWTHAFANLTDNGTHTGITYLTIGTLHYLQGFLQRENW